MDGKDVKARLAKLAKTNTCDEIDERIVQMLLSSLDISAKIVCGMVWVKGAEPASIHDVAKQLCETLNVPLVPT